MKIIFSFFKKHSFLHCKLSQTFRTDLSPARWIEDDYIWMLSHIWTYAYLSRLYLADFITGKLVRKWLRSTEIPKNTALTPFQMCVCVTDDGLYTHKLPFWCLGSVRILNVFERSAHETFFIIINVVNSCAA